MLDRFVDRVRMRTSTDTPVQRVQAVTAVAAREFLIGEEVRARIDAIQRGGIARVLIENQPFSLRLPFHVNVGDTISLTVSAREPVLRFAMNDYPARTTQASGFSDTARFITALLAESEKLPVAPIAQTSPPLFEAPPHDAVQLAAALRDALSGSGMFYEAHQAQWVAGERSLASLFTEPQGRLPGTADGPKVAAQPADPAAPTTPPAPSIPEVEPEMPDLPVHRDVLPIVRQQLETLDSGQVAWRGLVWNDQPMEWHVTRHEPRSSDEPYTMSWQTRISLSLPHLGDVTAALLIGKQGITIAIHAGSPDTAASLTTQRAALQASLRGADINPLSITIEPDEQR